MTKNDKQFGYSEKHRNVDCSMGEKEGADYRAGIIIGIFAKVFA